MTRHGGKIIQRSGPHGKSKGFRTLVSTLTTKPPLRNRTGIGPKPWRNRTARRRRRRRENKLLRSQGLLHLKALRNEATIRTTALRRVVPEATSRGLERGVFRGSAALHSATQHRTQMDQRPT